MSPSSMPVGRGKSMMVARQAHSLFLLIVDSTVLSQHPGPSYMIRSGCLGFLHHERKGANFIASNMGSELVYHFGNQMVRRFTLVAFRSMTVVDDIGHLGGFLFKW